MGILCAYAALALAVGLAWLVSTRVLNLRRTETGAVMCSVVVANTGYLGYGVVAALLGFDSLPQAVLYDIAVSSPALILGAFSIGAAFGDRAGSGPAEHIGAFFTRNPALYAAAFGLVAPDALAPNIVVDASRILVVAILPVGFFAVGVALAEMAQEGVAPLPPPFTKAVALTVVIRLVIAPALLLGLAVALIDLPDEFLLVAAMPCGINALIVTQAYGLDLRVTSAAIAWSTAIAVAGTLVLALVA